MSISEIGVRKPRTLNVRRYLDLTKPRVVILITFTALVGMLLSTPGLLLSPTLFFGLIGIGFAAAAGAALNHVIDQRFDELMERTRSRPLPTGDIDTLHAAIFAITLAVASMVILGALVNLITTLLSFIALIGYSIIYTIYLKRNTPLNIVWGGIAGAMPPLLGWTAATGVITLKPLVLVAIIFFWTPPHFWSLAIKRRAEYARAGIPMLPITHGVAHTKLQILLYTLLLCVISVVPFFMSMSGWLYLFGAMVLGSGFIYYAVQLLIQEGDSQAMPTFAYSIFYLASLFTLLLVDHYLQAII